MDLLSYRYTCPIDSKLGDLHIVHKNDIIYSLTFSEHSKAALSELERRLNNLSVFTGTEPRKITGILNQYFSGDCKALAKLETAPQGSSFQRRVWTKLKAIPAATNLSYGQLAQIVGCPTDSQILAEALKSNPVQLAIPCHRVTGSHGVLVDYIGGLDRKVWINKHELKQQNTQVSKAA